MRRRRNSINFGNCRPPLATNAGTLTNFCGGVIEGSGTVAPNPVTRTTSTNSTPVPEFPTETLVPLTLFALVSVALLARSLEPVGVAKKMGEGA